MKRHRTIHDIQREEEAREAISQVPFDMSGANLQFALQVVAAILVVIACLTAFRMANYMIACVWRQRETVPATRQRSSQRGRGNPTARNRSKK